MIEFGRKTGTIFLVILFMAAGRLIAQAPKYSNEFLSLGVGARSLALSGSVVAGNNGVYSGYWNPAGLVSSDKKYDIGLMHAEYFAGIAKYDYLGGAFKLDDSNSIGISIIRFGVDDIPNTLELIDKDGNVRYDRIKTFSAADYAFIFSYSRKTNIKGLSFGSNLKVIRRKTGDFASSWGFGLDAGAKYDYKKWQFGIMGRDITSTFNAWTFNNSELKEVFEITGNEIPENSVELTIPKLIIGAARNISFSNKIDLMVELDANVSFDGKRHSLVSSNSVSIDPCVGIELDYIDMIFLRFGFGNFQFIPGFNGKDEFSLQPNLGLGLHFKNFYIDYALTDIGDQSLALYSNIFSIRYKFSGK
ncbi:PorV/PorQ family protein [Bacteroidota bacterium]